MWHLGTHSSSLLFLLQRTMASSSWLKPSPASDPCTEVAPHSRVVSSLFGLLLAALPLPLGVQAAPPVADIASCDRLSRLLPEEGLCGGCWHSLPRPHTAHADEVLDDGRVQLRPRLQHEVDASCHASVLEDESPVVQFRGLLFNTVAVLRLARHVGFQVANHWFVYRQCW